jgi:cytochrome c6
MNKERFFTLLTASAMVAVLYGTLSGHSVAAFKANIQPLPSANVDAVALFGEKCAMCHGKNGAGQANWKAKGQPDFTNAEWQKSHTDAQITEAIANGKGKYMKAYKDLLSAEEIGALVARIRAFSKKK